MFSQKHSVNNLTKPEQIRTYKNKRLLLLLHFQNTQLEQHVLIIKIKHVRNPNTHRATILSLSRHVSATLVHFKWKYRKSLKG